MPQPKRRTNEEIIAAYKETGSVWKAARLLGLCGQSVWERLKILGYSTSNQKWEDDELQELKILLQTCTLSDVAMRLGRTYASVASMASKHNFTTRYGNRKEREKNSVITQDEVFAAIDRLRSGNITVTPLSRMIGVDVEMLVKRIQKPTWNFGSNIPKNTGAGDRYVLIAARNSMA